MEQKFYKCSHCNKIIAIVKETGAQVTCCNEVMKEIKPKTNDTAFEKHLPVYTIENNIVTVTVGTTLHPMENNHYIEWISLKTKFGNQRKALKPNTEPKVTFALVDGDEVEAVYAYCNLHGLWLNNKD